MPTINEFTAQANQEQNTSSLNGTQVENWLSGADKTRKLQLNFEAGTQEDADQQARIFNLQLRTGLPQDFISRNLDTVEAEANRVTFDAEEFRQTSPVVADWLSQDPNRSSIAQDDLSNLSLMEASLRAANQDYKDRTTLGERVMNRVKEGFLNLGQTIDVLKRMPDITRGLEAEATGDFVMAYDPAGIPIYASQVVIKDEQLAFLVQEAIGTGEAQSRELAKNVALTQAHLANIEKRPATVAMLGSESVGEMLDAFAKDPLGIIADIGITSSTQQLPAIALTVATRNPGVAVAAAGGNSYALELGHGIIDYLGRQGVDVSDPEAVVEALKDESVVNRALAYGQTRGVIVGSLDALSGGVAEKSLIPTNMIASQTGREALNTFAAQPVVQGLMGATGEAGAQLATTGEIEGPGELFAEFIGEFSQAPIEAGAFALDRVRKPPQVIQDAARAKRAVEAANLMNAMDEAARESKTKERSQEAFDELLNQMKQSGDIESVFVPVDEWNTYFQSREIDPRSFAEELIGDSQPYLEALATGGDIAIPLDKYASRIAGSEFHVDLVANLRFDPNDMTLNEAQSWEETAPEIVSEYLGSTVQVAEDQSAAVYEDVLGQLLAAGTERSVAEAQAKQVQSVFRTLGERSGVGAQELYAQYGLEIARQIPDALQPFVEETDTTLDPLIDRVRSGEAPTDLEIFGPSLIDFAREQGGFIEDSELSARDAELAPRLPGQINLLQEEGRTLDDMAELAAEAGFIQERDIEALLDAIDTELAGGRVSAQGALNEDLLGVRDAMTAIEDRLGELGVDIEQATNEEIKAILIGQPNVNDQDAGNPFSRFFRQIFSSDQQRTDVEPRKITQKDQDDKRGQIQFTDKDDAGNRRFRITLLEQANLSTFLHETGHMYLEILGDLAEREDAPQQIQDDYQQALEWMGVSNRDAIGTEQHEQWARGFEAYLREGKAPSPELQSVFSRFRAWLIRIYKELKALNVTLTDEVRGVFDRLVATDEEIEAAVQLQRYGEMFTEAEGRAMGMSESEYEAYRKSVEDARVEAEADVAKQAMSEISRENQKWWKEARVEMREEVAQEIYSVQVYRALSFLQKGVLPDGSEIDGVKPVKLDKAVLVEMYGQPFLKRLPKPWIYTREGGAHPDTIAPIFGYQSGDEMIRALVNARPMNDVIEAETDMRMRQVYGDMRIDGTVPEKAMNALHNEKRVDVMMRELRVLNRNRVSRETIPTRQVIRAAAQRIIGEKRVRDLNLNTYRVAEAKAAREAFELAAQQDFDGASEAKRKQLLNHELYRQAQAAKEASEKNRERVNRFSKKSYQETLGLAGADYQDQMNAILNGYEFKNIPLKRLDQRESLREFLSRHESDVQPLERPAYAQDDTQDAENRSDSRSQSLESLAQEAELKNWRSLTVNELQGVRDNAEMIWHLAKLKDQLLKNAEFKRVQEAAETGRDSINDNANRKVIQSLQSEIPWNKVKSGVSEYLAKSRRVPQIIREMDGGKDNGVMWQLYVRPINEATSTYTSMIQEHSKTFGALYDKYYTKSDQGKMLRNAVKFDSIGVSMTKDAILSVAMNWGNQVNRNRLMAGEGWSQQQVQTILDTLNAKDWAFVQEVWDYLDTYKKPFFDNHKAIFGIAPEEVEADPFTVTTRDGETIEMRGGYYPVKFDNTRAVVRPEHQMKAEAQRAIPVTARTKASASYSRVQGRVAIPIKLSVMGVVNQHVSETIHHIAFDQPLLDVAKVLARPELSQAITENYGKVIYDRLYRQLVDVKFGVEPAKGSFERFIDHTRNGASVAGMALSVTTTLLQPLGLSNSVVSLRNADEPVSTGYYWLMKGLARMAGDPRQLQKNAAWVTSNSEFMRYRRINPSREIGDVMNRIRKKGWRTQMDAAGFWAIANTQFWAVDMPTWYGAYEKAKTAGEDHVTSVQLADQTVRDAQGGGELIDQTEFQRGGPYMRVFTNFISYVATTWSIQATRFRTTDFKDPAQVFNYAHDMMMLMVVPAVGSVLLDLIASASRGDDEDDEGIPEKIARETAMMYMGPFVGVRELQGVARGFSDYAGPAGLTVFGDTHSFIQQAEQAEADEAFYRSTVRLGGILFHLPAVQIDRTTRGAHALYNGETDNPGALLFGPPRED